MTDTLYPKITAPRVRLAGQGSASTDRDHPLPPRPETPVVCRYPDSRFCGIACGCAEVKR